MGRRGEPAPVPLGGPPQPKRLDAARRHVPQRRGSRLPGAAVLARRPASRRSGAAAAGAALARSDHHADGDSVAALARRLPAARVRAACARDGRQPPVCQRSPARVGAWSRDAARCARAGERARVDPALAGDAAPLLLAWAPAAAQHAQRLGAYADALAHYEAAADALAQLHADDERGSRRELELLLKRAEMLYHLGRRADERVLLEQAA